MSDLTDNPAIDKWFNDKLNIRIRHHCSDSLMGQYANWDENHVLQKNQHGTWAIVDLSTGRTIFEQQKREDVEVMAIMKQHGVNIESILKEQEEELREARQKIQSMVQEAEKIFEAYMNSDERIGPQRAGAKVHYNSNDITRVLMLFWNRFNRDEQHALARGYRYYNSIDSIMQEMSRNFKPSCDSWGSTYGVNTTNNRTLVTCKKCLRSKEFRQHCLSCREEGVKLNDDLVCETCAAIE